MEELKHFFKLRPILGFLAATFGFTASLLLLSPKYEKFDHLYTNITIDVCVDDINESNPNLNIFETAINIETFQQICYEKIRHQHNLNNHTVDRYTYQHQHLADFIVMWMVVGLTGSGVFLAAYQIISSSIIFGENNLSTSIDENASIISIEKGKLYFKSSVTGLFILVISFAFFYIYTIYVYKISSPDGTPQKILTINKTPYAGHLLPGTKKSEAAFGEGVYGGHLELSDKTGLAGDSATAKQKSE